MFQIDFPELSRALLTASLTILGGIAVFVVGQIVEKFFIDPLDKFRRTLGDISFNMIYFANIYTSPGIGDKETMDETSRKLRELASRLISDSQAINGYRLFSLLRFIPTREHVRESTNKLLALSISVHRGDVIMTDQWRKDISSLLRLGIFN